MYYDGQFDDARLNLALAQTAALAGATVANYTEVTRLIKARERGLRGGGVGGAGGAWRVGVPFSARGPLSGGTVGASPHLPTPPPAPLHLRTTFRTSRAAWWARR